MKIERQTFVYYHVYLLWNIKFAGYIARTTGQWIIYYTHNFTFARQKSTL